MTSDVDPAGVLNNPAFAHLAGARAGNRSSLIDYGPGGLMMIYSSPQRGIGNAQGKGNDGGGGDDDDYVSSSEDDEGGGDKTKSDANSRSRNRFSALNFKDLFTRRPSTTSKASLTASSMSSESILPEPKQGRKSSVFSRTPSAQSTAAEGAVSSPGRKSSVFSNALVDLAKKSSANKVGLSPIFGPAKELGPAGSSPSSEPTTSSPYVRHPSSADVDAVYTGKSEPDEFSVTNPTDRRASGLRVEEHRRDQERRATAGPGQAEAELRKLGLPQPAKEAERAQRRLSQRRSSKAMHRRRSSVPTPRDANGNAASYLIPEGDESVVNNNNNKDSPELPQRKTTPSGTAPPGEPPRRTVTPRPSALNTTDLGTPALRTPSPAGAAPPARPPRPTQDAEARAEIDRLLASERAKQPAALPARPAAPLPKTPPPAKAAVSAPAATATSVTAAPPDDRKARAETERVRQVERGHAGALLKKTKKGAFHMREFTLKGTELSWFKSDGVTHITVDVRGGSVADDLFAIKKYTFQVALPGETITLAASGEADRSAWVKALSAAMAHGPSSASVTGRRSVVVPHNGSAAQPSAALKSRLEQVRSAAAERAPPMSPLLSEGAPPRVVGAPASPSSPDTASSSVASPDKRTSAKRASLLHGYRRTSTKDAPEPELDRLVSPLTFRVVFGTKVTLWLHCASQVEYEHWILVLLNAARVQTLKKQVDQATHKAAKADAARRLDAFLSRNPPVTYNGYMEKLSLKSNRNWKRRYFILAHGTDLSYYEGESVRKEKGVFAVTDATAVFDTRGERRFLKPFAGDDD